MSSELPLLLEAGLSVSTIRLTWTIRIPQIVIRSYPVQKDYQPIEELQAFNIANSSGSSSIKILNTLYLKEFLFSRIRTPF